MCMTTRSQLSSILGEIRHLFLEYSALELQKFDISPCYHSSAFISCSIIMIFIQNVYDHKLSNKFDFGAKSENYFQSYLPLNYKKIDIAHCYHSSAFISCSIMMIFTQNMYDHKISAKFDFGL